MLILEDSPIDAELEIRELKRAGYEPQWVRVQTESDFVAALAPEPELILADYQLPGFTGEQALQHVREAGLEMPFIIVSGAIDEERAVSLIRQGASDYLLKDRLSRLGPAVFNALEKRRIRLEKARARRALQDSERRLRALVDNCADIIALFSADCELRYASPAASRILGYEPDQLPQRPWELLHPDDRADAEAAVARLRGGENRIRCELRLQRRDRSWIWLEIIASNLLNEPGVEGIVLNARDVTERRQQQEKIARLSRVRSVLSGINSTILRVRTREELFQESCRIPIVHGHFALAWIGRIGADASGIRPLAWNGAWSEALAKGLPGSGGYLEHSLVQRAVDTRQPVFCNRRAAGESCLAAEEVCGSLIVLPLMVDGTVTAVLALYAHEAGFFDDDELNVLMELAADISFSLDHIGKEERLRYLAYYDSLTGLANRALFTDRLDQTVRLSTGKVAVLLLSLDQLTDINDSYGLRFGDALLQQVTARLKAAWPAPDRLGQIGHGVFGLVLPELESEADLPHLLDERIFGALKEPFGVERERFRLTAKLGIALAPADGTDAVRLLHKAEVALAKARYSNERYAFYSADMTVRISAKLSLEARLRQALEQREFVLYYQPKVDSLTRKINGLEALIRWRDPATHALIAPDQFVPVLEETGLIVEVGRWVLEQAAADYRRWSEQGLQPPRIAVNVSPVQLQRQDFINQLIEVLRPVDGTDGYLDLEITESMLMDDIESSIRKLAAARSRGLTVAIDDFGTGYSSLSYIARLPINALKIDRSFTHQMTKNPDALSIVTTIISLAHALKLKVIAEGVETEEQATFLKLLRCDEMQGFLFSPPLPPGRLEAAYLRRPH